jgi:phage terminase large subunit-like protein
VKLSAAVAASKLAEVASVHPMLTFRPSPALADFVDNDDDRLVLVRAANRVGKTRHGTFKAARFAVENPESRGRFVGPTRRQVQDVVGRYLSEFLGPHLHRSSYYTPGRGWNQPTIRLRNGSLIQLRSYEDHPTAHAGDELDWALLDEPPPSHILMETLARLMSRRGRCWLTMTPVGRPVDWLRELVEAQGSPWRQYVAEFSAANCPWYTDEQVTSWLETMEASPWEYEQRIEGAWDGVTLDRFFAGFGESNVDPAAIGAGTSVEVALAIDHGEVGSNTVALLIVWGGGQSRGLSWAPQAGRHVWVLDEHVSEDGDSEVQHAAGIVDMLRRHAIKPSDVKVAVGDTNRRGNWRVNDMLTAEVARQLKRRTAPFRFVAATKDRSWGHRVVNGAFKRRELFVHPRCESTLRTLRHWKGGKTGEDGDLSHAADALRYGVLGILGDRPFYAGLRF